MLVKLLRFIPLAVVICVIGGFMVASDSVALRGHFNASNQHCFGDQIKNGAMTADVLFLGNSRMRRGVDLKTLKNGALKAKHPMNFARAFNKELMALEYLETLLIHGARPNIVFWGTSGILDTKDDKSFTLGTNATIMGVKHLLPARNSTLRWRAHNFYTKSYLDSERRSLIDIFKKYVLKVRHVVHSLRVPKDGVRLEKEIPECYSLGFDLDSMKMRYLRSNQYLINMNKYGNPYEVVISAEDFQSVKNNSQLILEKIRSLSQEFKFDFYVSFIPDIYVPPLDQSAVEKIQAVIPEFVFPDEATIRKLWKGYKDSGHFLKSSRIMYAEWLSRELVEK